MNTSATAAMPDVPVGVGRQWEVRGLEMEDTVRIYDTLDGRTLVTPSNEVYIYSPRFAAVRQVVGLVANEQKERLSDVYLNTSLAAPNVTQKIGATKQQVRAGQRNQCPAGAGLSYETGRRGIVERDRAAWLPKCL